MSCGAVKKRKLLPALFSNLSPHICFSGKTSSQFLSFRKKKESNQKENGRPFEILSDESKWNYGHRLEILNG